MLFGIPIIAVAVLTTCARAAAIPHLAERQDYCNPGNGDFCNIQSEYPCCVNAYAFAWCEQEGDNAYWNLYECNVGCTANSGTSITCTLT